VWRLLQDGMQGGGTDLAVDPQSRCYCSGNQSLSDPGSWFRELAWAVKSLEEQPPLAMLVHESWIEHTSRDPLLYAVL
jgi:hypothetical protein